MGFQEKALHWTIQNVSRNLKLKTFDKEVAAQEVQQRLTGKDVGSSFVTAERPTLTEHISIECSICRVFSQIADATGIVWEAAKVFPAEGFAWDYVGGFAAAKAHLDDAIEHLPIMEKLGGEEQVAELKKLLPKLAERLTWVKDWQDLNDLAVQLQEAQTLAFNGQRAVRRHREELKKAVAGDGHIDRTALQKLLETMKTRQESRLH